MKIGSYVRYVNGDVKHIGRLDKLTAKYATITTVQGSVRVSLDGGEVTKAHKPRNFEARLEANTASTKSSPKRRRRSTDSKVARARELLLANGPGNIPSRKEGIELLVAEAGLTPAGASTYYANIVNEAS